MSGGRASGTRKGDKMKTVQLTQQEYARLRLALKYAYSHLRRCHDTNPSVSATGSIAMRRIEWAWPIVSESNLEV